MRRRGSAWTRASPAKPDAVAYVHVVHAPAATTAKNKQFKGNAVAKYITVLTHIARRAVAWRFRPNAKSSQALPSQRGQPASSNGAPDG